MSRCPTRLAKRSRCDARGATHEGAFLLQARPPLLIVRVKHQQHAPCAECGPRSQMHTSKSLTKLFLRAQKLPRTHAGNQKQTNTCRPLPRSFTNSLYSSGNPSTKAGRYKCVTSICSGGGSLSCRTHMVTLTYCLTFAATCPAQAHMQWLGK